MSGRRIGSGRCVPQYRPISKRARARRAALRSRLRPPGHRNCGDLRPGAAQVETIRKYHPPPRKRDRHRENGQPGNSSRRYFGARLHHARIPSPQCARRRVLSPGWVWAAGSVTHSPESQCFALRTGRGGPTPPTAQAHPGATRRDRVRRSRMIWLDDLPKRIQRLAGIRFSSSSRRRWCCLRLWYGGTRGAENDMALVVSVHHCQRGALLLAARRCAEQRPFLRYRVYPFIRHVVVEDVEGELSAVC